MSPEARPISVVSAVDQVRGHLRRRIVTGAVVWGLCALATVLLLAVWFGAGAWESHRWMPVALDLALLLVVAGAVVGVRRLLFEWIRERRVTQAMEGAASLPPGAVQGALELGRHVPDGTSAPLALAAERGVAERLRGDAAGLAGVLEEESVRWLRRGSGLLAVLSVGVLVAGLALPARSVGAWGGLLTPVSLAVNPALPRLEVTPGDVEVLRGAPLDIRVRAAGREEVSLHWTSPGELPGEMAEGVIQEGATFRFPTVTAPFTYWAQTADGARTARYTVTPVDPLFLSEVMLELVFPPHTGRLPEEFRGEVPPLTIPAGTRIRVEGRGSRDLQTAAVDASDGGPGGVELTVDGSRFSGDWSPLRDGSYTWRLRDLEGGAPGVEPAPLDLVIVPDSVPFVRVAFPGRDTIFAPGFRQPLVVEAGDDHGVAGLELVARRISSDGQAGEERVQRMEVGGTRGVLVRPTLDASGWGLMPGDSVRYFARVVDNAPTRQEGRSVEYVLAVPGATQIRDQARNRLDDAAERLEELAARADQEAARNRDQERQAGAQEQGARPSRGGDTRADPMEFSQQEELRRSVEEQAGLTAGIDSLAAELRELEEGMRESGLLDPGLRADLRELESLLDEIASPEMRQRLEELSQALDRNQASDVQDAFREMSETQQEFRDRLEESLEQFRRAAAQQDLRATTAAAEEMARRQEAVTDAMERGDNMELRAEQQEQLTSDAESLAERMEQLQERLERSGEPEAAQAAQQASQQAADARQAMEQAAQRARAGENQEAARQGQQASQALQEAVQQLQQGQQEMQDEMQGAVMDALRQTAEDALTLARRQGELRDRMEGASAQERGELRADEQALLQGVNNLAQNLAEASRGSPEVDRQVGTAMGQAGRAMEQTMDALQGQGRSAAARSGAEDAMEALNAVARLSMENARRIEEGGEGQGGEQSLMDQLEQLAQEQGQVNAQTGQMMPLQLSGESMQSQMEQIAQGQEAVAGELGSLASQPGANDQTLGDLEALAREAEALARELAGGRIEPETQRRQERLFQRLLDAGRSLEQEGQEESEEREGEAPGSFERLPVQALDPADTGLRYALPGSAELQSLPPAQRQLVLEYFERLNRMDVVRPPPVPEGR